VKEQLLLKKQRRMFASLKMFSDWQSKWLSSVRANMLKIHLNSTYRTLYINAQFESLNRRKQRRLVRRVLREVAYFSQD